MTSASTLMKLTSRDSDTDEKVSAMDKIQECGNQIGGSYNIHVQYSSYSFHSFVTYPDSIFNTSSNSPSYVSGVINGCQRKRANKIIEYTCIDVLNKVIPSTLERKVIIGVGQNLNLPSLNQPFYLI